VVTNVHVIQQERCIFGDARGPVRMGGARHRHRSRDRIWQC
jgi:hypothetical protein